MGRLLARAILAVIGALAVLLVPACELEGGHIQLTGPPMSPEISTVISLAAGLM